MAHRHTLWCLKTREAQTDSLQSRGTQNHKSQWDHLGNRTSWWSKNSSHIFQLKKLSSFSVLDIMRSNAKLSLSPGQDDLKISSVSGEAFLSLNQFGQVATFVKNGKNEGIPTWFTHPIYFESEKHLEGRKKGEKIWKWFSLIHVLPFQTSVFSLELTKDCNLVLQDQKSQRSLFESHIVNRKGYKLKVS